MYEDNFTVVTVQFEMRFEAGSLSSAAAVEHPLPNEPVKPITNGSARCELPPRPDDESYFTGGS
jgi:hypothetical protein